MIPKGVSEYHGISLVEVVRKVVTPIINRHLSTIISFHDVIHRLCAGCGTGSTSLEAKLTHQLTSMREEFVYAIFVDLCKAYDTLDRYICL